MSASPDKSEFDQYAGDYDGALTKGISVSGENKEFFARGRIAWLATILREKNLCAEKTLDFGCGTGQAAPLLKEIIRAEKILGVDVSEGLLGVAQREHGGAGIEFRALKNHQAAGDFDLAFCNGVFHHIPPTGRDAAVNHVFRSLKPGGIFAFWENNPWNPGTRYVMSRIPFDRDAITLSPPTARRLLREGGFEVLQTDFQFFFPRSLSWFRELEPWLAKIPLGAQYQVFARKPD
jgi:SAM-dependent methyltransferase